MTRSILGVDIGGSGMKAARVDVDNGCLLTSRHRIKTPKPAQPAAMVGVFEALRDHFDYTGPIGCTFPGVILDSAVVASAANLDDAWVGADASALFGTPATPVTMINDGDAAGIAEMTHGAGRGARGTVIMITIGTGLGTAVFSDGQLLPNTEFGPIEINGLDAELRASSRVIDDLGLTYLHWAPRFQIYLEALEALLWPSLFILGGGISKDFDVWGPLIDISTPIEVATTRNHAGIIGAAMVAAETR